MRWLVQKNLVGHQNYIVGLWKACEQLGHTFVPFIYIPFSGQFPKHVLTDEPTILYAATGPVHIAGEKKLFKPGVFYNEDFKYSKYLEALGERMVNFGPKTRVITLREAREEFETCSPELIFLRPDKDLKEFAGGVVETDKFSEWVEKVDRTKTLLNTDCRILLAEPVEISTEWRLFVVDREVITGSQYKKDGRLAVRPHTKLPEEVVSFGKEVASEWTPHPVCVMDIGKSGDRLYVVEFNCMNSSGFYSCDIQRIVGLVSEYVKGAY